MDSGIGNAAVECGFEEILPPRDYSLASLPRCYLSRQMRFPTLLSLLVRSILDFYAGLVGCLCVDGSDILDYVHVRVLGMRSSSVSVCSR